MVRTATTGRYCSITPAEGLKAFTLPAGAYGHVTVRPVLGFLWGPAIGKAKRNFYTRWLPGSAYRPAAWNMNTTPKKSMGKRPSTELFFAMEKK